MNSKDISNAIKARLLAISPAPEISWPNVEFNPGVVPRWEVTIIKNRTDPSLKGGGAIDREDGSVQIVICTAQGIGEDACLDDLDLVRAAFAKGDRFSFTGGQCTIMTEPSQSAQPFPDKTSFRLPTSFDYVANAT